MGKLNGEDKVVLAVYDDKTAVLYDSSLDTPFIVAKGYDKETGECKGDITVFENPTKAFMEADPSVSNKPSVIMTDSNIATLWKGVLSYQNEDLDPTEIAASVDTDEFKAYEKDVKELCEAKAAPFLQDLKESVMKTCFENTIPYAESLEVNKEPSR